MGEDTYIAESLLARIDHICARLSVERGAVSIAFAHTGPPGFAESVWTVSVRVISRGNPESLAIVYCDVVGSGPTIRDAFEDMKRMYDVRPGRSG